jgi:hypothetical protein
MKQSHRKNKHHPQARETKLNLQQPEVLEVDVCEQILDQAELG